VCVCVCVCVNVWMVVLEAVTDLQDMQLGVDQAELAQAG